MTLFDKVFREEDSAIDNLMNDDSCKQLILSLHSDMLSDSTGFIRKRPTDAFLTLVYNQKFAGADESVYVAKILISYLRESKNVLPSVEENRDIILAHKCLVSLSLFKDKMENRYNRLGYPHPDYYRRVSRRILYDSGNSELADHHKLWEDHISNEFILNHISNEQIIGSN